MYSFLFACLVPWSFCVETVFVRGGSRQFCASSIDRMERFVEPGMFPPSCVPCEGGVVLTEKSLEGVHPPTLSARPLRRHHQHQFPVFLFMSMAMTAQNTLSIG